MGGELYGVTTRGGTGNCGVVGGCGTAYEVNPSGTESILHSFASSPDGEAPNGPFIEAGDTLYATTTLGGNRGCKVRRRVKGCGTVFDLLPSGTEHVLYRFAGGTAGASPQAPLTLFKHEFYGEANAGGTGSCRYESLSGCGLIFKMSRSGRVRDIYSFKGSPDGRGPQGGLLLLHGKFYGATSGGGSYACPFSDGCGTVFEITPSGNETLLHAFKHASDGAIPQGGLTLLRGRLYGATFSGGKSDCAYSGSGFGCGTVYEVTLSGHERVVYSFSGTDDGAYPNPLLVIDGKLYGTTGGRGAYSCGTLFELSPSGELTTLYAFKGGSDGCGPSSGLIGVDGVLYGTTSGGGAHDAGTVYAFTL